MQAWWNCSKSQTFNIEDFCQKTLTSLPISWKEVILWNFRDAVIITIFKKKGKSSYYISIEGWLCCPEFNILLSVAGDLFPKSQCRVYSSKLTANVIFTCSMTACKLPAIYMFLRSGSPAVETSRQWKTTTNAFSVKSSSFTGGWSGKHPQTNQCKCLSWEYITR